MAEPQHRRRKPQHGARSKPQERGLWTKLKGSAAFWLIAVFGFTILVVSGIIWLSALLSGN